MLVQFTFGNFRSFKDQATLNLIAASKLQADPDLDTGNVFVARERPRLELLRVAALYGANASGKSNVALALEEFQECVAESANVGFRFALQPFLLNTSSGKEPTFHELTFLIEGVLYRYGFEVKTQQSGQEIVSEWLYQSTSSVETVLFERTGDQVKRGRRFTDAAALLKEGRLKRKDSLYLSLAAQLGSEIAAGIVAHITGRINVLTGLDDEDLHSYTVNCMKEGRYRDSILQLIREADTGIPEVVVLEEEQLNEMPITFPEGMPNTVQKQVREAMKRDFSVMAVHPVWDEKGDQVRVAPFPMKSWESQGTQKLFAFAGPILDTLDHGNTLFVDEMDARFHPLLTQALIRLFQSPESNPKNAQLIFITHDTNLLDPRQFRRDQIWFVEKDRFGASHLYSLADFKGVRKDASFEEDYIRGRYGAIPFLGGLSRLFTEEEANLPEPAHAAT